MSNMSNIFILCGNARTFLSCVDSCYENLMDSQCPGEKTIYFYLKTSDPGPKGQEDWNFSYENVDHDSIVNKITEIGKNTGVKCFYKILPGDEIKDDDLLSMVKDRTKYIDFYSDDRKLIRSLHCFFNFERCGDFILSLEDTLGKKFDNIIYCRPDLFFTTKSLHISKYNLEKVIKAKIRWHGKLVDTDHCCIIPRKYMNNFFFDRMKLIRENTEKYFRYQEIIYDYTIPDCENQVVCEYYVKRS